MHEDSPPPFVVFRTASPPPQPAAYDRALALVGMVHEIVGKAVTRFYLKDRLDRAAIGLVFELGRATKATGRQGWRNYRAAEGHACDVATVLDILAAQHAAPEIELQRARTIVRELIVELAPRQNG